MPKALAATAALIIVFTLAACGGGDTTTTVQAPATTEATTSTTTTADPTLPLGWSESGLQDWLSVCVDGNTSESDCRCIAQEIANRGVTDTDIYASPDPSKEFRSEVTEAVIACGATSY